MTVTVKLGYLRHLSSVQVHNEVHATHRDDVISDACAATIASWYQTSTATGSALASLASGAETVLDELLEDVLSIESTYYETAIVDDQLSIDALGAWVYRKKGLR